MPRLANSAVAQLFTVPASDWTVINKRVGSVMAAQEIEAQILPYLPTYPDLLSSCRLWEQSTFDGMQTQSQALVSYATTAIANFTDLNQAIQRMIQSGTGITPAIQQRTIDLLQKLCDDTVPMVNAFTTISTQVLNFLNYNKSVDAQIAAHKDSLGNFWAPIGAYIILLENAAGLVTGEWRAITDDLQITLASHVNVDMPFLESLDIAAAIVSWTSIQTEARDFPAEIAGQKQYWTNPF